MLGATGLMERPDPRRVDDAVDMTANTAAITAARVSATLGMTVLTLLEFLKQKSATLDIVNGDELTPTGPRGSNWQALRNPTFRWYFTASVVSNFGTRLQNAAQVVLAYQLTHSVFMVGLVTCAQFTSPLALGACAGVVTNGWGTGPR
jgi:hypothetical protein